jgi:hypothetical protein
MKAPSTWPKKTSRLFASFALGAAGVLAFLMSLILLFGWLFRERSSPAPNLTRILILFGFGVLVLASSVSCFILARRVMRSLRQ